MWYNINIEILGKITDKNTFLKDSLNFYELKNNNLDWLLKKICHDALAHYINNFTINGVTNEKEYFLYIDHIVDFLKILIQKNDFDIQDLLDLHKIILTPLIDEKVKNIWEIRTHWVITKEKIYHKWLTENFISEHKVKKYMNELFLEYKNNDNSLEKIITLYNYLIAKIHPFTNWNGRTLAILLDTLLIKHDFLPLFLWWQNKNKRVVISEDYIKHRNMNKLISDNYKVILDIYSHYQIK